MKKLYYILIFCILVFSFFITGAAYNLSEKEYQIIDRVEQQLFELIDTRESITPERVEELLIYILENRDISQRHRSILEVILDDLQYSYYL